MPVTENEWPEFPDGDDLPKYDQYMTRDEARAVFESHLDLIRPFADHPNPEVRAVVAERTAAAEAAFQNIDGFYEIGALPRHRDLPDTAHREIRARNLGHAPPKPSLWARLTGKA
ncbi:hypothetical protein DX116_03955 [Aeromicrobium endophyticum]|uniref:Uncharacterized protein n=1 Tax=Aeromicrobium endophyticum TaxID=2292704 RepID=A0A371PA09_9ACTN|nr:hypothetical protein DX116_03955 [Aeromicrobium endophyticum]